MRVVNRKVQSGEIKVCGRCGEAKDLQEFKDKNLATKYGRFCKTCKGYRFSTYPPSQPYTQGGLTKSEDNRFESFIEAPEKYARNTAAAKAKIVELLKLRPKLTPLQQSKFFQAHKAYTQALEVNKTEKVAKGENNSKLIKAAIQDHSIVRMRYKGVVRDVHPYVADSTYFVAYCTLRKEVLTFRIDKMQSPQTNGHFSPNATYAREASGKLSQSHNYTYRGRRRY